MPIPGEPVGRVRTGVIGFDELIGGGLLRDRVYLICGPPGSGKTTFAIQFLVTGALSGENGLFISTLENPRITINDMSNYTFGLLDCVKSKRIYFMDMGPNIDEYSEAYVKSQIAQLRSQQEPPTETKDLTGSFIIQRIENFVKRKQIKRLVVDSIASVKFGYNNPDVERKELGRFIRKLKQLECTTILLGEMTDPTKYTMEQFLAHGVIFLHNFLNKGKMTRAIQIMKMMGIKHDCDMRELNFTNAGLMVLDKLTV
jgi:KaiC/GvpD/RAD55 family RecA-like ATPase